MTFLRGVREGHPMSIGPRVAVVGAGDTAMDCARTARRVGASSVTLVYRRTVDQMPADPEEIHALRDEGIEILELARPIGLRVDGGRLVGLVCTRTEYRGDRDAGGRKIPHDVADAAFEMSLDTLVVAISQHAVLDLFGEAPPQLTPEGFIATDPVTQQTSIPGVYAGGDVAAHGPASIVRAAADGKRAADAIAASLGVRPAGPVAQQAETPPSGAPPSVVLAPPDVRALALRRAHREYRVPIRSAALGDRAGFAETTLGYTAEEAVHEATRCLDCDVLCSLCVGVCPNMALLTYEVAPRRLDLASLAVSDGAVVKTGAAPFAVEQGFQVAVLTDLCNECGDCVTVCPTAGAPYRDKPRLYLDRADFEAQSSNAFLLLGGESIEGRFDGSTHRLTVGAPGSTRGSTGTKGRLAYAAPGFDAVLDQATLDLQEATPTGAAEGDALSLEPAAMMATLLAGISASLPHLPTVAPGGTRVAPPHASRRTDDPMN